MTTATQNEEILELVLEHLSLDADELTWEETREDVQAITGAWSESVRDLSHLPRQERQAVLQRTADYRPQIIDGTAVYLFSEAQVRKGAARVAAAIVDCGDQRFIALGF